MKKLRLLKIVLVAVSVLSLTACSTSNEEIVSIDGSTSMEKVVGYLSESYMEENSNVKISYNPTGSGAGIQAVIDGRCDIGLSSRNLNDTELQTLNATVIAIDGIAIIVNNENPLEDLTMSEVVEVYTGNVTNWSELGGNDLPIVCIGREASSGTRDGFESITNTTNVCQYSQELTSNGDIVQAVSSNPNAIGYVSLASVSDSVKTISIENIMPSNDTILDGSYKIQRNFIFVTPKDRELSSVARGFYEYALSGSADEYIIQSGAIPIAK
jgi:phosphate transport system substrate-binding protein